MITYSDDDDIDVIYEKLRRKRLSPNYYLQCIERFVEVPGGAVRCAGEFRLKIDQPPSG